MAGIDLFVEQEVRQCRHFTGIHKVECKAGVRYVDVLDDSVRPFRWPCINPEVAERCAKRDPYTEAEAREHCERIQRRIESVSAARAEILKATQGKVGVSGKIVCPLCRTGDLRYSVAAMNGHVHARCSTDNCVAWME